MRLAFHPGLYDPDGAPATLHGTRCDDCGTTFFPPLTIGCEVCGALEVSLRSVALAGAGIVHSVATVHLHASDDIEAPFTVAEVQLDDGPLIRATMTEVVDADVIGRRTHAELVVVRLDDDGNEVVELRFAVEDVDS